ncbi:FAD/NAD-P-binding domain-containing protein [Clavulina sp. PMI_390]|nr:FAD/NAD-P-binding domain-containing protein [Clavulina sp. PMI_390]
MSGSTSNAASEKKVRVAVIGSGAAGSSCAYALSKHPERYEVTVFDKENVPGGMATSLPIDADKYGASYINDGVQGCSPQFSNTLKMFELLGYKPIEVGMQISFGKGENFWSNVFPSSLTRKFEKDIAKFGRVLKTIKRLEVLFAFIPVHVMLKMFRFDPEFGDRMVYPLVALFFGTGNQTPYVSTAILERVFMDPSMKLFEFNSKSLLASIPTMYGFPKLHDVYAAWAEENQKTHSVTYKLGCEVTSIVSRSKKGGVVLEYKASLDGRDITTETFDKLVMACDADSALKILGKASTWRERKVLGSVKYLWDVTITHNDVDYMNKVRGYYETSFNPNLSASPTSEEDEEAIYIAERAFRPLYYTMQYDSDKKKIEMSFDLTHYQPQFRGEKPSGPTMPSHDGDDSGKPGEAVRTVVPPSTEDSSSTTFTKAREPPFEKHVFQTIFLDRDSSSHLWTIESLNPSKRIAERWWKQQSHRWQHYLQVVPWMWMLNDQSNTVYAGAWTMLNMHEIALVSGFSAAYRLGAEFPFKGDEECERLWKLYYAVAHGGRVRKADRKGFFV